MARSNQNDHDRDEAGRFAPGHALKFDRAPARAGRSLLAQMRWKVPARAAIYSILPDGYHHVRVVVWDRNRRELASWCVREHGMPLLRAACAKLRAAGVLPRPIPRLWIGWVGLDS